MKCLCCKKEISDEQANWSGLCPCCDLGVCQSPAEYHKLEKRNEELMDRIEELLELLEKHNIDVLGVKDVQDRKG